MNTPVNKDNMNNILKINKIIINERRASNPQPSPWQDDTLPIELLSYFRLLIIILLQKFCFQNNNSI